MKPSEPSSTSQLMSQVLRFQLKLSLEAARDLVLIPVTLAAAALDLLLAKRQPPQYFRALITFGQRSDDWLDLWAAAKAPGARTESVDSLMTQVESVLRDPRSGGRRAKVLLRWAERNLARQRRAASTSIAPPPPPPPPTAE